MTTGRGAESASAALRGCAPCVLTPATMPGDRALRLKAIGGTLAQRKAAPGDVATSTEGLTKGECAPMAGLDSKSRCSPKGREVTAVENAADRENGHLLAGRRLMATGINMENRARSSDPAPSPRRT
jgi:hypothetical protein